MKSFSPFLEVKDLKKYFPSKKVFLGKDVNPVRAVDGISFALNEGETLGLVGESGSENQLPHALYSGSKLLPLVESTLRGRT
tara:strand:- start:816 stop:1061 length:246 start_codon:yes stop_codon:yes gene_type:complete